MSNKSSGTNIIILFIISAFVAGFVAYIYIKTRKFEVTNKTINQTLVSELFLSLGVTLIMVIGSFAGAFLMSSDLRLLINSIPVYAITFLIEIYFAMLWGCYLKSKYKNFRWIHTATYWLGLFLIFTLFSLVGYYSLPEMVINIPYSIINSFNGAVAIAQDPIGYIKWVFEVSGGNQFIIVKEFPKWSIYLLAFSMIGIGVDFFKPSQS